MWGRNQYGKLGFGSTEDQRRPQPVSLPPGPVSAVAAGADHSLALVNGALYAWGKGGYGQLGLGTFDDPRTTASNDVCVPQEVAALAGKGAVTHCAAGSSGSAAVVAGALYTWGRSWAGQPGLGDADAHATPQCVDLPGNVTAVSLYLGHLAALVAGDMYMAGENNDGQHGLGHRLDMYVPQRINLTAYVNIAAVGWRSSAMVVSFPAPSATPTSTQYPSPQHSTTASQTSSPSRTTTPQPSPTGSSTHSVSATGTETGSASLWTPSASPTASLSATTTPTGTVPVTASSLMTPSPPATATLSPTPSIIQSGLFGAAVSNSRTLPMTVGLIGILLLIGLALLLFWDWKRRQRAARQIHQIETISVASGHSPSAHHQLLHAVPDEFEVDRASIECLIPKAFPEQTVAGVRTSSCQRFHTKELLSPTYDAVTYHPEGYAPKVAEIMEFCTLMQYHCTTDDPEIEGRLLTELWATKRQALRDKKQDIVDAMTLYSYTVECDLYKTLNAAMRRGNEQLQSEEFAPYLDYIYLLSRALLQGQQLGDGCTGLYRGISVRLKREDYPHGRAITWQAFSSTTQDLKVAMQFLGGDEQARSGTLFFIRNSRAARGISAWSQYPEEEEWLYPPNTHFRVVDRCYERDVIRMHTSLLQDCDMSDVLMIVLAEM